MAHVTLIRCRMTDWLQRNLSERFSLPPLAVEWLLSLFNVIQVFDDATDGDKIDPNQLRAAIYDSLAGFYLNPFFRENAGVLVPLLAVNILKWNGANQAERDGAADAMSFSWRAGYYDVVLMVVNICHGPRAAEDNARAVMSLYGEKYADYLAEFNHA